MAHPYARWNDVTASRTTPRTVAVVGGGWAGMSAATHLNRAGLRVTLLERAAELGGRAASFYHPAFDEYLDSGTHLFIGAYAAARQLLEWWGAAANLSFAEGGKILWLYPGGVAKRLSLSGAWGIQTAWAGIAAFPGMSPVDRFQTLRALRALAKWQPREKTFTVAHFLARYGISENALRTFWHALVGAVMNVPPARADVAPLAEAVKAGLVSNPAAGRLGLPHTSLHHAFNLPARLYLAARGVEVRLSTTALALLLDSTGTCRGVHTSAGSVPADAVVAAVPPDALLRLLPHPWRDLPDFRHLTQWEYSPIAAVHLAFDRPVLGWRIVCLANGFAQWLFGRGQPQASGWSRVSAVISHVPRHRDTPVSDLGRLVLGELTRYLPSVQPKFLIGMKAVRTVRATVVLSPESRALRLPAVTPIPGLFLAGDWCDTGLPATIESAARAGKTAAEAAAQYLMESRLSLG